MDIVRAFPDYENVVLAITKSTNKHILIFYWTGSEVSIRWILRHENEEPKAQEASMLHKFALGIQLVETAEGPLEIKFSLPMNDDRKLYFVSTSGGPTKYAIIFHGPKGPAQLSEIYMDLSNMAQSSCVCRCIDLGTKTEFVERKVIDMGPLASLF